MCAPPDATRGVAPYEASQLDSSGIIREERLPCYCLSLSLYLLEIYLPLEINQHVMNNLGALYCAIVSGNIRSAYRHQHEDQAVPSFKLRVVVDVTVVLAAFRGGA